MKTLVRNLLILASSIAATQALAQGNPVSNAILAQKAGDLDRAKLNIDGALKTRPEEANTPKYWFTKGSIYYELTNSSNAKFKALAGDTGALVAYAALSKVRELEANEKRKEYTEQTNKYRGSLFAMLFNTGGQLYNAGDQLDREEKKAEAAPKFMGAYNHFVKAAEVNPKDTNVYNFAIAAAYRVNNTPAAEAILELEEKLAKRTSTLGNYINVAQMYQQMDNKEGLRKFIALARSKYPQESKLIRVQLQDMLDNKDYTSAMGKVQELITAEPQNTQWVYMMGSLYAQKARNLEDDKKVAESEEARTQALNQYIKANSMDSTNSRYSFDAGAIIFNRAKAALDKADELDVADRRARNKNPKLKKNPEIDRLVKSADDNFKLARNYFEQALRHGKEKDDKIQSANALMQIYGRIRDQKNATRIEALLKDLEK